ncbi:hypothetical protein [Pantoea agglomerans]|uniref:hypothetical protein n=1 Tax=Enterobacter agglomerans TaxID=549 RepID=UPI0032086D5B
MKKDITAPGEFSPDALYIMIRSWVLSQAPFPVDRIRAPEVANALMKSQSGLSFNMSQDIPPVFSGDAYNSFSSYKDDADKLDALPAKSTAWFTAHLSRIETTKDFDRFENHLSAMMTWMHVLGYLEALPNQGYLATSKLLENGTFTNQV